MSFWPPTRGDAKGQLERASFSGVAASNTYRGMVWAKITATAVEIYKDRDLGASDLVASGTHSAPTSFTKITLSAENTSGLTGSVYLKYTETDSTIEIWPTFATDTELTVRRLDITRYPKSSGTTFVDQHLWAREEFVRLLKQRIPPLISPRRRRTVGTLRGDVSGVWRVNSIGDYECVGLANLADYREWAIHYTLAQIYRVGRTVGDETQLQLIEEEDAIATKRWAEVIPQEDPDYDYDADEEVRRFKIRRG